jgi:hypothetical protein
MSSNTFLAQKLPCLEQESVEYVTSIADDHSLTSEEKLELLIEYLGPTADDLESNLEEVVAGYLALRNNELAIKKEATAPGSKITADALAACIDVLRAPSMKATELVADGADKSWKRELVRIYDSEQSFPPDAADGERQDEILGLGPNENKTRIMRERLDARVRAKQEQDEVKAQRTAQKLKAQAETIKSRTVSRKK